jgi:hypothetical protein
MSTSDLWNTPTVGGECQDFTRWWNSEGQFLQPIGDMQSEYGLDFAKKIAESVYSPIRKVLTEAQGKLDEANDEVKACEDEHNQLVEAGKLLDKISDIVEITLSSKEKEIKTLIKKYREDYED